jgi:stearoyl-CoA desaturase (delta-9 desaturase)
MTDSTSAAFRAPFNWAGGTMLIATFAVAVTVVPWYLWNYEVSLGAWLLALAFLAANGFSITAGYHRLWAHKTYNAHGSLRFLYMIFGAMALQNSALIWCSQHRIHHNDVDDVDRDPYSAKRGLWFSHVGWMLRNYPSAETDLSNVKDLQRDPLLAFQHKYYVPLAVAVNFGFVLLAGWLIGDVWSTFWIAGVLRLVLNHHFTFFINSLAHYWGKQPYTDTNSARDNPVLALLTYGEGYHNFHHIFAHDYRNGVRWWQWDPTKWLIATMSWLGLARNLKRVPNFQIQRAIIEMQFKRAQARLEKMPATPHAGFAKVEEFRARLAHEYDSFKHALAEWARLKDEWYAKKKEALAHKWEEASFRTRLREVEYRLKMQRKRMRLLHAQLVYAPA